MDRYKAQYTLFKRKDSRTYYFYYRDAEGKRVARSTGKTVEGQAKAEAERFLGGQVPVKRAPTLKAYAGTFFDWERSDWIRRQHAKGRPFSKAVAQFRQIHLDKHILPEFGKRRLDEINQVDVERWLIDLELSNQTKNHILYTLRIILRDAVAAGKIEANPLERIEPMGKDAESRDIFTLDDYRLLFPRTNAKLLNVWREPRRAALFMLLATTGLRSGEVRALKWENAIEEFTALAIREAVKEHERTIGSTKSGDQRVVLLPARTAKLLKAWHGQTPYSDPGALIFYGKNSKTPLASKTLTWWLSDALDKAEIITGTRKLVVHSFRHTYNSMMRNVLPAETLRALVGHKSEAMTNTYDHPQITDLLQRVKGAKEPLESFFKKTV